MTPGQARLAQVALAVVWGAFAAFTAWVCVVDSYLGIFIQPWRHPTTAQAFVDLCLALGLVLVWIYDDWTRRLGRSPVGALLIAAATCGLGSLVPLAYLVWRTGGLARSGSA